MAVDCEKLKTTFVVSELFELSVKEFRVFYINNRDQLNSSKDSYPKMYDLYDDFFQLPFESCDDYIGNKERSDFYKAIEIMLFSFYKVWGKALRNQEIERFNQTIKPEERDKCIEYFYENMKGSHSDVLEKIIFDVSF